MAIRESFYSWLSCKYGWGEETYKSLDEEFRAALLEEFNVIRRSYGMEAVFMFEVS